MEEAIQDEASFHAILALASDFSCTIHQHSSPILLQNGLLQKIVSLADLQQRLQKDPTDLSTLRAIMDLAGAAFYEGDAETAVLHHQAAKNIVSANGGLSKVATDLRDLIGVADSATSWSILERPVFPIDDWDPGTWSKQSLSHLYFQAIEKKGQHAGSGLVWDSNNQTSIKFLSGMLTELNELVIIRNLMISVQNRQHRNEIYRWLHVRRSAIKTHLLHYYLNVTEVNGKLTMEGTLEAAVCVAAWYCHGFIIYQSLHVSIHFSPQTRYYGLETLLAQAEITSLTHLRLLLWLCFVGAVVEELFGPCLSGKKMKPFTVKFLAIVKRLELASYHHVREILESFLFDSVLDEYLVRLLATPDLNMESMGPGRRKTV